MKEECIHLLQELTGKEHIIFTRRGNSSISNSLEVVKEIGKKMVLIQDQGGWMTYEKLIEENKLNCMSIKTYYGLVNPNSLMTYHDVSLLINSMPGYAFTEDMKSIEVYAENNDIFIINDVTGSIGTEAAKIGDIIFGSFGKWKPLNVGEGGFIATNDEKIYSLLSSKVAFNPTTNFFKELEIKSKSLNKRLNFLKQKRDEIIEKLKKENFDIIMPDAHGLNLIVKTNDKDDEKNRIEDFCKKENVEFTECPRYIRVNIPAISLEIKRLEN